MNASDLRSLAKLIAAMPPCQLRPREFFIAWHGVPTLAFQGFPPAVIALKKQIENKFPELAPENSGSRWPKSSLGATRPGAPPMTLENLRRLRELCDEANANPRDAEPWRIESLRFVSFLKPSLEKLETMHEFPARGPGDVSEDPTPAEMERVDLVMSEFAPENLEQYLAAVTRPGRDMDFYRREFRESTLAFVPPRIPDYIQAFRRKLDAALPGLYDWFADAALHVTIRSLRMQS